MSLGTLRARLRGAVGAIAAAVGVASACVAVPTTALAVSPYTELPPREEVLASAAHRYANMSNEDAFAELDRRGISYRKVGPIGTVRAPIRLEGSLHGVHIHSALPEEERATSMFEILDARLALALDDFAIILERHDVVELVHYTMFRPNMPAPGSPEEKALHAKLAEQEKAEKEKKAAKERAGKSKSAKSKPKKAKPKGKSSPPKSSLAKGDKPSKSGGRTTGAKRKDIDLFIDKSLDTGRSAHDASSDELAKGAPKKTAPKKKTTTKREPSQAHPPSRVRGVKGATRNQAAKKADGPKGLKHAHGKWAPPGTRHPAGLAIDVGILKKRDGSILSIAQHFRGKIGERTCGEGAAVPEDDSAKELRAIVCGAREAQVFTYALTPNYDADHVDHFHMELKPVVEWFLYH